MELKLTGKILTNLFIFSIISKTTATTVNRVQKLDQDDYVVSWSADLDKQLITFKVEAATLGFVGFGLSPQGGMSNADVVIGGVKDGIPYFTDRFSTGKSEPKIDESQDWKLLSATENVTHTILQFERALNTCDDEDLPIKNDTTKFIWSIGATDDIRYHAKRGASSVNILDPASPVFDVSDFQPWDIKVNTKIPAQDTTYWCTLHKSPVYTEEKRQIVGYRVMLDNEDSLEYNHHLILHHCVNNPSNNNTALFEGLLIDKHPGGECYFDDGSGLSEVMQYCQSFFYVWAKGGDPLLLPKDVGLPLNEDGVQEYFMLEIHYDNPKSLPNVQYETGLQVYTTADIREKDAGVLVLGHDNEFSMLIPPDTDDFVLAGHCSPECTESKVPENGITIFNVLLHSHLAGRKIKLRQFREGKELPWVASDEHYDFNYQQNRPLLEIRKILRGDQLTVECTDSSTHLETPAAIIGGIKTVNEMCEAFIMYWPRIPTLTACVSGVNNLPWMLEKFGIEQLQRTSPLEDQLVLKPDSMAGKYFSEVISTMVNWTAEFKDEFQQITRFSNHLAVCGGSEGENVFALSTSSDTVSQFEGTVNYPKDLVPYQPPTEVCYSTHYGSSTPEYSSTPKGSSGGLHAVAFFVHTLAMSLAALTLL